MPVQRQASTLILRLAEVEGASAPSAPYIIEFVEQVSTLSDGKMTIQPVWDAGDMIPGDAGIGTIQLVRKGDAELGLMGSMSWDMVAVPSFQALQASYLIDNDALAKAVATSDVARQMLDDLSAAGIVGLTLWPEDLRHPFSMVPERPILSPQDIAGLEVKAPASDVTKVLKEAMGGTPTCEDTGYQAREIGLRQIHTGLLSYETAVATGNVTFFSKFMVLFENEVAFKGLTEAQRSILRDAAAAVQAKAIAEHPGEANLARAWCENGGTVVMVSDEQVAAFKVAAQPVFDWLKQDPFNAEMLTAIRQLKESTEPSAGAEACVPEVAQ